MDTVTRDLELLGSRVRYWEYGTRGNGPTIVVVHGYRGDHHGLEPVVNLLPDFHIVSPDLPGFGDSTPMTDAAHSIAGYGAWLRAFIEALGLGADAILLGHSFGSIVVAHAVADGLPARAVILINPIADDPAKVAGIGATKFYYAVARRLPERAARAWLSNPLVVQGMSVKLAKTRDRRLRRFIHGQHHAYFSRFGSRASIVEGFEASLSATVADVAAQITQPVLLVAGERDEVAPLAGQFALLDAFPDARLDVIPGVGHLIHYETPEAAAHAVRAFVTDLDA
ncbi:alpha/beta fold hydrolase [Pseudolysinimonas yzui]|uniref:Hydrolase n=1 Tax=Pseudolysinimonas yzui TaxID=2708254 RepID=A0A8J3LZB5_9MICO|nr:alpha/beta hydrolase [Pseudolysinimonas yzui]GHF09467.1 hydrolase [Pseudolysinimonas yzui]